MDLGWERRATHPAQGPPPRGRRPQPRRCEGRLGRPQAGRPHGKKGTPNPSRRKGCPSRPRSPCRARRPRIEGPARGPTRLQVGGQSSSTAGGSFRWLSPQYGLPSRRFFGLHPGLGRCRLCRAHACPLSSWLRDGPRVGLPRARTRIHGWPNRAWSGGLQRPTTARPSRNPFQGVRSNSARAVPDG